jgi:N6-L-threonylcarbamoyladenine synthase
MKILSIETSCDETAISLLEITGPVEKPDVKVLGNSLYSQAKLHAEYGGVYPTLAKREHQKNLPILLEKTLKEAGGQEIDFIAVTTGPGLEPALWTGIVFAEELGKKWQKPVVGVNHMEGHIYSVLASLVEGELALPALALLISGGHTELVLIKSFGNYEVIGHTLDDAAGEAYDKAARMLGLPYPGGPEISRLAEKAREEKIEPSFKLPRPMLHSPDLNFSFSGLKTAVLYKIRSISDLSENFKKEMAYAFEEAVCEVLVEKTSRALNKHADIQSLIVAGGVAANQYLCSKLEELKLDFPHLSTHFPTKTMATDNAIMIGLAAYIQVTLNPDLLKTERVLEANGNLSLN